MREKININTYKHFDVPRDSHLHRTIRRAFLSSYGDAWSKKKKARLKRYSKNCWKHAHWCIARTIEAAGDKEFLGSRWRVHPVQKHGNRASHYDILANDACYRVFEVNEKDELPWK